VARFKVGSRAHERFLTCEALVYCLISLCGRVWLGDLVSVVS